MDNLMIIDTIEMDNIANTLNKIGRFQILVQKTLKPGHDYDIIPGTNKPTLLKPGAEKISMMFGINPEYDFLEKIEDYKNEFFAYDIRCTLYRNGQPVAQGVGSCNSKEKKYRYVNVPESEIPSNVDKSQLETVTDKYGRTKYKIDNPDICSLANTILKMAKKRAYIDATLQVAALSEIFTQDIEDMKDIIQNEQTENMTIDEAAALKITFGKQKGKTIGEIYKSDIGWIKWYVEKADKKDPVILKAIEILKDAVKQRKEKQEEPIETEIDVDEPELPCNTGYSELGGEAGEIDDLPF